MTAMTEQTPYRIIFFHKHPTSARTRFLLFDSGSICAFSPLPDLAQMVESGGAGTDSVVVDHPASIIRVAAEHLNIEREGLSWEPEFEARVDIPGGSIPILLCRFTGIDPPFAAAEALGACFIDLTEARSLKEVELLLLRRAYEVILGG